MAKSDAIPGPTVRRLSLYLRQLEMYRETGLRTVSSKQLGESLQLTDAQVRKDLAVFGHLGHPGIGYRVEEMIGRIRRILGTDRLWNVALVGAGNLGRAFASYRGFVAKGFNIVAVFDADPSKIGTVMPGADPVVVQPVSELAETIGLRNIDLAILAVPISEAQAMADQCMQVGVRGILNFAPMALRVAPGATIINVDLAVHLEQLSFRVCETRR